MAKTSPPRGTEAAPDPQELAQRFVDLWQQQLAAVAADDTLATTMLQMSQAWFAGATTPSAAAQPGETGETATAARNSDGSAAAGAAAGGAAPVADGDELEQLRRRVAELERRVARLDGGADGSRGEPKNGRRRR